MSPETAWRQKANYNFSLPSDFAIPIYSITVYLNIVGSINILPGVLPYIWKVKRFRFNNRISTISIKYVKGH